MTSKRLSQRAPNDASPSGTRLVESGASRYPPGPVAERLSQPPVLSGDTGGTLFLGGKHYYRQIDDLCMNICVAKTIDDEQWSVFLEESLRLTKQIGREGRVIIASYLHAHPSAWQRRLASDFLARNQVPTMTRMGVISNNPLVRGALIALGWTLPKATMRTFKSYEFEDCLQWLKEVAVFDLTVALDAWREGSALVRG